MTAEEATQILALISLGWPRQQMQPKAASFYGSCLMDLDFHETYKVIDRLIYELDFPPSIAKVHRTVIENRCNLPEPEEAWDLVCQRWGTMRGSGDSTVELGPVITAALDAAAIDSFRFHNDENRHWLRQGFLDAYTPKRNRTLKSESEKSRILNAQDDARPGLGAGADEEKGDESDRL